MSNMDSHGIPDNEKHVESVPREFERRAEDKSPVSTTPALPPVMAAPTSSDEKEEEADTAADTGRGHTVEKTKRSFGEAEDDGGSRAEDVVKAELSSLPTTPQGSGFLAFDRSKWKQMNQGRNLTMYCIQICLFDESLHHMYTLFPFRVAVFSNQPAEPDPVPHRLRCCWDPDPVPHRRSLRCHPNPSRNHPPRRRLRRPPGSTSPCVL